MCICGWYALCHARFTANSNQNSSCHEIHLYIVIACRVLIAWVKVICIFKNKHPATLNFVAYFSMNILLSFGSSYLWIPAVADKRQLTSCREGACRMFIYALWVHVYCCDDIKRHSQ